MVIREGTEVHKHGICQYSSMPSDGEKRLLSFSLQYLDATLILSPIRPGSKQYNASENTNPLALTRHYSIPVTLTFKNATGVLTGMSKYIYHLKNALNV